MASYHKVPLNCYCRLRKRRHLWSKPCYSSLCNCGGVYKGLPPACFVGLLTFTAAPLHSRLPHSNQPASTHTSITLITVNIMMSCTSLFLTSMFLRLTVAYSSSQHNLLSPHFSPYRVHATHPRILLAQRPDCLALPSILLPPYRHGRS